MEEETKQEELNKEPEAPIDPAEANVCDACQ